MGWVWVCGGGMKLCFCLIAWGMGKCRVFVGFCRKQPRPEPDMQRGEDEMRPTEKKEASCVADSVHRHLTNRHADFAWDAVVGYNAESTVQKEAKGRDDFYRRAG
ncbi:hypothetical protein ACMFMF_003432 [Clarireedia jacksonii]